MELNTEEQQKVRSILGRTPTKTEETIFSIQWSEHCSYKSSKRFLKNLPTQSPFVILGPGQDSGIVAVTDNPPGKRWGIVISHESHNHPSQIVPLEGAATGIGGSVRDVLCMGARVIGCLDMLRFGDGRSESSRTIIRDVIRGIGGYSNPIGVPNLGGNTFFDQRYNFNCLVNAIAIGLVREDHIISSHVPQEAGHIGYDIILIGKATDRSGFGGAAFASAELLEKEQERSRSAVQEPNPFLERHIMAAFYDLFEWLQESGHIKDVSCKDLGAGGIVCASVEQVSPRGLGARIELTKVHRSRDDLPPEMIACAETQERMCFMVHPDLTPHILQHVNQIWDLPSIAENARATVIGKVTNDGMYHLTYKGQTVCKARSVDITCGVEYSAKERPINAPLPTPPSLPSPNGGGAPLLTILSNPNNASKEPIFIHFDKSVIGNTILEPGEADATVIAPLQDQGNWTGVTLACAGPVDDNPYQQAFDAVSQAMRKVIAVGGVPRALTDCLNYGNPEIPVHLWELAEGIRGLTESANALNVPFISGNVSLYNCADDGVPIPPTATICCIGVLPDARTALSMVFKNADSHIAIIRDDDLPHLIKIFPTIQKKYTVLSAHTITRGLLLSILEMSGPHRGRGGVIGCTIHLDPDRAIPTSGILIESKKPIAHPDILPIGHTTLDPTFLVTIDRKIVVSAPLSLLHTTWKSGIPDTIFEAK